MAVLRAGAHWGDLAQRALVSWIAVFVTSGDGPQGGTAGHSGHALGEFFGFSSQPLPLSVSLPPGHQEVSSFDLPWYFLALRPKPGARDHRPKP